MYCKPDDFTYLCIYKNLKIFVSIGPQLGFDQVDRKHVTLKKVPPVNPVESEIERAI